MKTTNGYEFKIKNKICTLFIPKNEGLYKESVQLAQNEICLNNSLPYFKEIKIAKVSTGFII